MMQSTHSAPDLRPHGRTRRENSRRSLVLTALSILLLTCALFTASCREDANETPSDRTSTESLEIGAIFSLTGNAAPYGKRAQRGIDLAVAQINDGGGIDGHTLVVEYEDDKGDPREGVTALNKLITVDRVPAVLGPQISGVAMAVSPIAQKKEVVLLLPGANTPELDDVGDYIFRNMPSSTVDGRKAAEVIFNDLGVERVAVTYPTNAGSTGIALAFMKHFSRLGGSVVAELPYEPDLTNFRTIIQRIKDADVDLVYAPGYNTDVGLLIKQSHELGLGAQFFGAPAMQSPKFLEIAGPAAEDALFTNVAFDSDSEDEYVQDFVAAFEGRYGTKPDVFAAMAYDAAKLLAIAVDEGGYSSEAIRQYLQSVDDYPGVSGITSFDDEGNVEKDVSVYIISNGEFLLWSDDES